MSEFPRVSNCFFQCPKETLLDLRVNKDGIVGKGGEINLVGVLGALLSGKAGDVIARGVEGMQHAVFAASECPSRSEDGDAWQSSDECRRYALTHAVELRPFDGAMTELQAISLGRVGLGPDLRRVEETPPPTQ